MIKNDEVTNLLESDLKARKNKYYPYAEEATRFIQERFPFGAINQVDVVKTLGIPEVELEQYLNTIANFADELDYNTNSGVSKPADIMQSILFGNCGVFTDYALGYMKKEHPEISFECMYFTHHAVLLIGRDPKSNPKKIEEHGQQVTKNFGDDALVLDLFARKSYLASDISIMQKTEKNISYYALITDIDTNKISGTKLNTKHYLYGTPEVTVGKASQRYDERLVKIVEEDLKRRKENLFVAPKTPLFISATLVPSEVKDALTLLSKCSGWKFSQKNGVPTAWIECKDQKQADRILKSLEASRVTDVSLLKRQDNGVPVIKCEYFDMLKLNRLTSSLSRTSYGKEYRNSYLIGP